MNDVINQLIARSQEFAEGGFVGGLKMMPSLKTTIIGCVDPRVDPAAIFGLQPGEAVVIRNVGGRVFPSTLQTLRMLGVVAKTQGGAIGAGWNLIVFHHTDCGIKCLTNEPELLAKHFEVSASQLDGLSISDPYLSVSIDVAALKANPQLSSALTVTGVVYDVATGKTATVVPPSCIRDQD